MNCTESKANLSSYIDDALPTTEALELRRHLEACRPCAGEVAAIQELRRLLRAHAAVAPPRDLLSQIRVRVALESQPRLSAWDRLYVRLQNFLQPVAIPATAGVLATFLIFCGFVNAFSLPLQLANDVPLALQTPPRLRILPPIVLTGEDGGEGLVVLTEVDHQGRVTDFRVLNSTSSPAQMGELRRMMMFTQFDPATRFGVPTSGRTVINVRRITITG
jgi:hypothetical protein